MRRITQSTITDRILGSRQDRQGVDVGVNARGMTALLRLWGKRTTCHFSPRFHALKGWLSAGTAVAEHFGDAVLAGRVGVCHCPALVEVAATRR